MKGHNCIIVPSNPINVVILVDQTDPIELWREKGEEIANLFIQQYSKQFDPNVSQFKSFTPALKKNVHR
ncbi:MAG: hypothetical protein ACFFAS_13895 [Promethearchaeota archaeon]